MATRPATGGASRPSTLSGALAILSAFAIGTAPIWALVVAGGAQ